MKKGLIIAVSAVIMVFAFVFAACAATAPVGTTLRTWDSPETGVYSIQKKAEVNADGIQTYTPAGTATIAITPYGKNQNETPILFGTYEFTSAMFDHITYDVEFLNGDFVRYDGAYATTGAPIREFIDRRETNAEGKVILTQVDAYYANGNYNYASKTGEEGATPEENAGAISVGEYVNANFFSNMQEYIGLRYVRDLNTKKSLNHSYKLPVWSENDAVEVNAVLQAAIPLKLSLDGGEPAEMQCYAVSINKTSTDPGVGQPRVAYYLASNEKNEDGTWTDIGDKVKIGEKTAWFILAGFDEGDFIFRLSSYSVG